MDISVIIVNYNTHTHLEKCLKSIYEYTKGLNYEVIVVDNNSTDRKVEKLPSEFPKVRFFFRNVNDGFGSGCNYGAKMSRGKYLLFLNPDIILKDDSIVKLVNFSGKKEDAGIVSGVMTDNKNNVLYSFNDFPSLLWEFYHLIGFGVDQKIKRLNNKIEIKENKIFEVDWFHGAFFMISKENFDKVKGFDEKYFMYYEDVEICFKVKCILKKNIYCLPEVKVFHYTQSSIKDEKNDNIFIFHLQRGKLLFFRNYKLGKRTILRFINLLYVLSRIIILPMWNKYKGVKKDKFKQLVKILKLNIDNRYLHSSKFEYIINRA